MKIALYSRAEKPKIESVCSIFRSLGVEYVVNPERIDGQQFDFAASLGGDGTFLDAVRYIGASECADNLPIIGINSGRLGFLATINVEECETAFKALLSGDYKTEERSMIEVKGIDGATSDIALNEVTIQRQGVSMIEVEIKIDEVRVASYWADGVIVSTPTGSTAYSMSVGGAILAPGARCFIISPVGAHNLSLRPLVVPDTAKIEITTHSRDERGAVATIDNSQYNSTEGQTINLTRSCKTLKIININDTNFYNTLRQKLYWGIDIRK